MDRRTFIGSIVGGLIIVLLVARAQQLDPNTAVGIAALGFVEGTKTAPEPVHLVSSGR